VDKGRKIAKEKDRLIQFTGGGEKSNRRKWTESLSSRSGEKRKTSSRKEEGVFVKKGTVEKKGSQIEVGFTAKRIQLKRLSRPTGTKKKKKKQGGRKEEERDVISNGKTSQKKREHSRDARLKRRGTKKMAGCHMETKPEGPTTG